MRDGSIRTASKAQNRRRLGRWRTVANVVEAEPGHVFSFVVQAFGGDWTQWTYAIEPGSTDGTTRLTETFRMCVALGRIRTIVEREAA